MDPSHLTQKSTEALHDAQTKALRFGHTEVDGEHLLLALLDQQDGIVPRLLAQADADPDRLRTALEAELAKRPKVTGPGVTPGQVHITQRLSRLLDTANQEADRLKDEYVSVEHLVMALLDEGSATASGRLLQQEGLSRDGFLQALRIQRWDDHRYYHHSRINQALHLLSASSFVCAYLMAYSDAAMAALLGWLVGMTSRQAGHFFFEPRDYDVVNQASHEYKEEIKVGYNLKRKVVLMSIWALSPLVLYFDPTLFGLFKAPASMADVIRNVGKLWLLIGAGGLLFRTVHLFFIKGLMDGLVWMTKILTDPFHDIMLYWKSPLYLMRGELIDPHHAQHGEADEEEELQESHAGA